MDSALVAAFQQPVAIKATLVRLDMPGGAICLTDGGFVPFDAGEGEGPELYIDHHPDYGVLNGVGSIKDGAEAQITRIDIGILPASDVATAALASPNTQGVRIQWWEGAIDHDTRRPICMRASAKRDPACVALLNPRSH